MTTWSPGFSTVRSTVSSAARPLANARPRVPCSSAARQVSSAVRVGLPRAAVLVALVLPDLVLHVGRGLVDRDDHRAGRRVRVLPRVDRQRLEPAHGLRLRPPRWPSVRRGRADARGRRSAVAEEGEHVLAGDDAARAAVGDDDRGVGLLEGDHRGVTGSPAPTIGSGGPMCCDSGSASSARPLNRASSRSRSWTAPTISATMTGGSARTTGIWRDAVLAQDVDGVAHGLVRVAVHELRDRCRRSCAPARRRRSSRRSSTGRGSRSRPSSRR